MTIDRTLENTLDARLATTVRAFAATAAWQVGGSQVDSATVRRLTDELGIQQSGAILTHNGTIAMQSMNVPAAVARVGRDATGDGITYATVPGDDGLRVAAFPMPGGSGTPATIVLWRLVGRGLEPLSKMAAVASEIEAHDLSRRLGNGSWDEELRKFAATFDRMLDRLQYAFHRQRQFTADASHDLRAPLAVIRAEVDLAPTHGRHGETDEAAFRSIRDEVMEFDRLLEGLLLAARADAGPLKSTAIDLADLAARATGRLRPFAVSGTGLGLAIAKSAVERVGGSILIRNVDSGGAEIETVFPLAR